MPIVLRNDKGSALTHAELDGNFTHLDSTKQAALVAGTNIKTINGNSLLGAGDLSVGSVNWSGQATRTANFNSVAGSWQEIEITGAGNIIGTLPASPADNEEHLFVCRPTATDPGGRFRLGLNGKVINGRADAATTTRSTGFELATIVDCFTEIGGSIVLSGSTGNIGFHPNVKYAGAKSLKIGEYDNGVSIITWTLPTVSGGNSQLQFYTNASFSTYGGRVTLNGSVVYSNIGIGGGWFLVSIPLTQNTNTVVFANNALSEGSSFFIDNMMLTGVVLSAPAAWTDVVPWQLNSGGRLAVRWNAAFQTWFVLEYYKGIYA